jgi:hypothetical protein
MLGAILLEFAAQAQEKYEQRRRRGSKNQNTII